MDLSFLKTKEEDKDFHQSRVMFCIKDGEVEVAPKGTSDSHIEWFENEGWVNKKNEQNFLETNTRGFYLPTENSLYCYKGLGFYFDKELIEEIRRKIPELKTKLNLNENTRVYYGPKDKIVNGREYEQFYGGVLSSKL